MIKEPTAARNTDASSNDELNDQVVEQSMEKRVERVLEEFSIERPEALAEDKEDSLPEVQVN